jgi:hypothetical protein
MSGRIGVSCAAALLLAVAGCMPSFLALTAAPRQKHLVAAPVGTVAAMLETGLNEAGVSVLTKRINGEVRLAGQTETGKIFCLYVRPEKGEGGAQTAVVVRWDREADEAFWHSVVEMLTAATREE